jgi:glutathione S-transferase
MQLIGMLDSPYVRRIAVALIAARVPFTHRPISLFRHIREYSKINPLLKAPTFVADDGTVLMDSSVIVDYLAATHPTVAALTAQRSPAPLRAFRATGLALALMEKAVQRHYERTLKPAEKQHDPWIERVTAQLEAGLAALEAELPQTGWIAGDLGVADISVVCALGFTRLFQADVIEMSRYPTLLEFCARAEALPAFRAAPAEDGVTAPLAIAD